jgi:hypothetical protein
MLSSASAPPASAQPGKPMPALAGGSARATYERRLERQGAELAGRRPRILLTGGVIMAVGIKVIPPEALLVAIRSRAVSLSPERTVSLAAIADQRLRIASSGRL